MRAPFAAALALAMLPGCLGARFTETEWRPELQARSQEVRLRIFSAALDPWTDRYVLEFRDDPRGTPGSGTSSSARGRLLVLELHRTIPDGERLDGARYLKAWRYEAPGRTPLGPHNSRLHAGHLSFQRRPEERVRGSYDLLLVGPEGPDGRPAPLHGELTELQITGTFSVFLDPPRMR
jgi:hypothetical protein